MIKRIRIMEIAAMALLLALPLIVLACGSGGTPAVIPVGNSLNRTPGSIPVGNNLVQNPSPIPLGNNLVGNATPVSQTDIMKKPLVTNIYTADPAAHVFNGKLYIYPSHDLDNNPPADSLASEYGMKDYHVFVMNNMQAPPVDLGEILNIKDVPWASQQMWAPDAAFKNGMYYLYFPARDKTGLFRIGAATSSSPAGPFIAQPQPIQGSFSTDPAVFMDDDGQAYMYFGALNAGQLEKWRTGSYDANGAEPGSNEPALGPRVAKLSPDMLSFAGPVSEVSIVDEAGHPLLAGDHARRFFDAVWMHKYQGVYYLSYTTGDTHLMVYATSHSPLGPFTYKGVVLNPVQGWTSQGSIVEFQGKWYLFYHDDSLSGVDNKRCMKVTELFYDPLGNIQTISP